MIFYSVVNKHTITKPCATARVLFLKSVAHWTEKRKSDQKDRLDLTGDVDNASETSKDVGAPGIAAHAITAPVDVAPRLPIEQFQPQPVEDRLARNLGALQDATKISRTLPNVRRPASRTEPPGPSSSFEHQMRRNEGEKKNKKSKGAKNAHEGITRRISANARARRAQH